MGQGRGLPTSKPLKSKVAGDGIQSDLGACVRAQIVEQQDQPNPITFTTPDRRKGRVWLAGKIIGHDRLWRVNQGSAAVAHSTSGWI